MLAALTLVLASFASGLMLPGDREGPSHTRVSLVAEKAAVEPGGTITFAAVFDIDKDWHIYWDGQNNTGQPPKFDMENLPKGVKLGEIGWPIPHRHVLPGDIVDHIYEKRAVVLLPMKVASDAKPGAVSFEVPVEWMECANVCQFGSGTVKFEFRVVEKVADAKPGAGAAVIAAARKAMPLPLAKDSPVTVEVNASTLLITAKGADSVTFMPHRSSTELADLVGGGEAKGEVLKASLKVEKDKPAGNLPIMGMLSIQTGKNVVTYWVDTAAKPEKKEEPDRKPKSDAVSEGTSPGR